MDAMDHSSNFITNLFPSDLTSIVDAIEDGSLLITFSTIAHIDAERRLKQVLDSIVWQIYNDLLPLFLREVKYLTNYHEWTEKLHMVFNAQKCMLNALSEIKQSRQTNIYNRKRRLDIQRDRSVAPTVRANQILDGTVDYRDKSSVVSDGTENAVANSSEQTTAPAQPQTEFKFQFPVNYDPQILDVLYTHGYMDPPELCHVQNLPDGRAKCLICRDVILQTKHEIVAHTGGARHVAAAPALLAIEKLRSYHQFWIAQEKEVQCHQIFFYPRDASTCQCLLLRDDIVAFNDLLTYIHAAKYRAAFLRSCRSNAKYMEQFPLFALQLVIYDDVLGVDEVLNARAGERLQEAAQCPTATSAVVKPTTKESRKRNEAKESENVTAAIKKQNPETKASPSTSQAASNDADPKKQSPSTSQDCSPAASQLRCNIAYDARIIETIYKNVAINSPDLCPIQNTPMGACKCLICADVTLPPSPREIEMHLLGAKHVAAATPAAIKALQNYHVFWMSQSMADQSHQIFFHPRDATSVHCILCGQYVAFESVFSHMRTPQHYSIFLQVGDSYKEQDLFTWQTAAYLQPIQEQLSKRPHKTPASPSKNVTKNAPNTSAAIRKPNSAIDALPSTSQAATPLQFTVAYDPKIVETLYKCGGMHPPELCPIQNVPDGRCKCLICVGGVFKTNNDVQTHLMGRQHSVAAATPAIMAALRSYHLFWMMQEKEMQSHQIFFQPRDATGLHCFLCGTFVVFANVLPHIYSPQHHLAFLKISEIYGAAFPLYAWQMAAYYNKTGSVQSPNGPLGGAALPPHTADAAHAADESKKKRAKAKKPAAAQTTARTLAYDPLIVKTIYKSGAMNPRELCPLQDLPDGRCKCLICLDGYLSRNLIENHRTTAKHIASSNTQAVDALRRYHTFWMAQAREQQSHQVFFHPKSGTSNYCILCKEHVLLNGMVRHLLHPIHHSRFLLMSRNYGSAYPLFALQMAFYAQARERKQSTSSTKSNDDTEMAESAAKRKHVIQKAVTCSMDGSAIKDGLEERLLSHRDCFKTIGDNRQICVKCNVKLPISIDSTKGHIVSNMHMRNYPKLFWTHFFCGVCNKYVRTESEWSRHSATSYHVKSKQESSEFCEYECLTCKEVIFGNSNTLEDHKRYMESKKGPREYVSQAELTDELNTLFITGERMESTVETWVTEANHVLAHDENVKKCCRDIEKLLRVKYAECVTYPFGSRICGLGNQNSDLDVFLDVGGTYSGKEQTAQKNIVRQITTLFQKQKNGVFQYKRAVPLARTPIVRVLHIESNLECDISFRNGLSVENTKFLKFSIKLVPTLQPLVLLLKEWNRMIKLKEFISSYALVMMAIFFLQQKRLFVSVWETIERNSHMEPIVIDGSIIIDYDQVSSDGFADIKPYTGSIREIFMDFLRFYATFPYETHVVCPLMGYHVQKSAFLDLASNRLPAPMMNYVSRVLQSEETEEFRAQVPFCVQDPFDLSHNLTKGCNSYIVDLFKAYINLTIHYLETTDS